MATIQRDPHPNRSGQSLVSQSPTIASEADAEPGVFVHWEGRRQYRAVLATPRVLEPVSRLSDNTGDRSNLVIEGDALQVMASLRAQFQNSVDVVLIDPPYNTGKNDFRYSDRRFHDPDADGNDAVYVSNEDGGRHTMWLNVMAPRLAAIRSLMANHGVLFVHINDIELFRVGLLLDEIFDERNRLGVIVWKGATDNNPTQIAVEHEYVLCYAKRRESVLNVWKTPGDEIRDMMLASYSELRKRKLAVDVLQREWRSLVKQNASTLPDLDRYTLLDERGPYRAGYRVHNPKPGGYRYDVIHPKTKKPCRPPLMGYRHPEATMKGMIKRGEIIFGEDHTTIVQVKEYLVDYRGALKSVVEIDGRTGAKTLRALVGDKVRFPNPKPVELEEHLLGFVAKKDTLILDAFAGSGTTAHAVMRLNKRDGGKRRFIMIEEGNGSDQYARTLLAPRLRAARQKEGLPGGFTFMKVGREIDREAVLNLERDALISVICQTDASGHGRGISRVDGKLVIGANDRDQAVCLHWDGRRGTGVSSSVLTGAFREISTFGLNLPMRIYGITCEVMETDDFTFCQLPDEVLNSLLLRGAS